MSHRPPPPATSGSGNGFNRGMHQSHPAGGQRMGGAPRIVSSGHSEGSWIPTRGRYDGRRMRPPVVRTTIDFNSSIVKYLQTRTWSRGPRLRHEILHGSADYLRDFEPVWAHRDNPSQAYLTKYVSTSVNKNRFPVFACTWTREGRRLYTGSNSGEVTLWDGAQFNFITLLQAHDDAVRCMTWSNNDMWLVTGDSGGVIKYWQSNMNNYKAVKGHKEDVRDISFCPSDLKFATASDDQTVGLWDFEQCKLERSLRGHGFDVKSVHWHPTKSLVVSGSKDNLIKLWDPRSGGEVANIHSHKNQVSRVRWNPNGLWFASGGRDHLVKVWDIRTMKEFQVYKDHKTEVTTLNWHPFIETVFCTGTMDGNINFFDTDHETSQAEIMGAHEDIVWDVQWHPLGHILASCGNDCLTRFWTRNRPGDDMADKYNVNQLPDDLRHDVLIDLAQSARYSQQRFYRVPKALEGLDLSADQDELEETFDEEGLTELIESIPGLGSGVQNIGIPAPSQPTPTMPPARKSAPDHRSSSRDRRGLSRDRSRRRSRSRSRSPRRSYDSRDRGHRGGRSFRGERGYPEEREHRRDRYGRRDPSFDPYPPRQSYPPNAPYPPPNPPHPRMEDRLHHPDRGPNPPSHSIKQEHRPYPSAQRYPDRRRDGPPAGPRRY